jgi:ParB-like chromosome segregation protein Spo0J
MQPVDHVQWVPIEQVTPNDYNPNTVARIEMGLLYTSIQHDGYTQPIVTVWDATHDRYCIVDGFHRYYVMKTHADIYAACQGQLPIVTLEKSINDRMASTVRHNRARGKHTVQGMSQMVFTMLDHGWSDTEICQELGMDAEELVRLKHVTGFSKLFADVEYQRAWMTMNQLRLAQKYQQPVAVQGEVSSPQSGQT